MSLHYLVKLGIRVLQVNGSWNSEPKNTPKCFVMFFTKRRVTLIKLGLHSDPLSLRDHITTKLSNL